MADIQSQNEQLLSDIQSLQAIEQDLYTSLETSSASGSLTKDASDKIIQQIKDVSNMRINLYNTLKQNYSLYQSNVSNARDTIDAQSEAVNIVENELNNSKKRLSDMQDEKNNKLRYVEINTYYGKQYNDYTGIMQIIIYMCIPIIILSVLANKGFLPSNIYSGLLVIIITIGVYFLGWKVVHILNAGNMDYDTNTWFFNRANAPNTNSSFSTAFTVTGKNPFSLLPVPCFGAACCDVQSTYDEKLNLCVFNPTPPAKTP
jgi:hypothetical protein